MSTLDRPVVIGHLGNTLAALARVRASGADGVEFDVRRGADGTLVLHHDPVLEGRGPISRLSGDQLPVSLPRLRDALAVCSGLVVNIEIKNLPIDPDPDLAEHAAVEVAQLLEERALVDHAIVSSFTLETLDAVRATNPRIPTGYLTLPAWDQTAALLDASQRGHQALHPHRKAVTPDLIDIVHSAGMWIIPWAVDRIEDVVVVAADGVDALITDNPDVALSHLGRPSRAGLVPSPGFPKPSGHRGSDHRETKSPM
jgi:glycerophosphoryl diester phosphodiesterase